MSVRRIVSGGQTGADRGGLDAGLDLGLDVGGWCPRGRRAEDGRVPDRYPLRETASAGWAERTERNVVESDATVVLTRGAPTGGSALTLRLARKHGRPSLHVDLAGPAPLGPLREWLASVRPGTLNVAGSRESKAPGIGADVRSLIRAAFDPRSFDELLSASSLGTPGAQAVRARTPPDVVERIARRSESISLDEAFRQLEIRERAEGAEPAPGRKRPQ
jgi:hypothetical protein